MGTVTDAIKHAAIEIFNVKPSKGKRQDCDPEMAVLIEQRQQAINRHNEEDVKQLTKDIKKMAAHKRTKTQLNEFYEGNWTSVKRARIGFIPTHTRITNQRGKTVNDRLRADTFAKYYEEVHWAKNNNDNDPDLEVKQEPIYPTCNDINTDQITSEELVLAIKHLRRNKAPGPDGTTSELYKLLDTPNRNLLLETRNECWNKDSSRLNERS